MINKVITRFMPLRAALKATLQMNMQIMDTRAVSKPLTKASTLMMTRLKKMFTVPMGME